MEKIILTTFTIEEMRNMMMGCIDEALSKINQRLSEDAVDKMMTVEEASVFLNLAPQTIYSFTAKRLIPFSKRSKRLYFSKKELIDWIKEGKRKTRTEIEQEAENYILNRRGSRH